MDNHTNAENLASSGNRFLDKEHLLEMCQGDPVKVRELAGHAVPILGQAVRDLRMLLARFDDVGFLRELHKLKGTVGVIEPTVLYSRVRALETEFGGLDNIERKLRSDSLFQNIAHLISELDQIRT